MPIKAVLETLDGVDDAVKAFYTETEGKFVLQVDGVDNHPEVANLKSAYERTKRDRESAKAETATLKSQIAELQKGAPDTAATQAKIAQLEEQLAAEQAKVGEWRTKYTGVTRDQALAGSLQSAGITSPTFLKAAQAMLSGMVKLGEDGTAYVETGMGPKVLGDFVKSWAATEGKDFVTPPAGGGSKGGGGGNSAATMKRSDFNALSPAEQQKAMVTDKVTLVD